MCVRCVPIGLGIEHERKCAMVRHLWKVVALAVFLLGCSSDTTTREADGTISEEGDVSVGAVREGDCIDVPVADEIDSFTGIPCDAPHDAQVFSLIQIAGEEFPGDVELIAQGESGCESRFEGFAGIGYQESEFFINLVRPSELSWERGDREIICLIVPEDGSEKLTQDLTGIAQ